MRVTEAAIAAIEGFQAGYVTIAGLPTWHEVGGEGPAVVLLHGGFSGAAAWGAQAPALASAGFRVHVPERRGHAHTRDVDGPLTYEVMAADTVAYLEAEVGGQAHLVGWSDGAVVALLVALRRPDLVGRMVLIGQYYNSSGRVPGSDLDRLLRSAEAKEFLRQAYDPVSPDGPEHFDVVYAKTMTMIDSEPEIDLAALATVSAPALVLQETGTKSPSSTGPRLPPLLEMAGSRCFRARMACQSNCPASSTRSSSRSCGGPYRPPH